MCAEDCSADILPTGIDPPVFPRGGGRERLLLLCCATFTCASRGLEMRIVRVTSADRRTLDARWCQRQMGVLAPEEGGGTRP